MDRVSFVLHGKIHAKKYLLKQIQQIFKKDFTLRFYETQKARHAEDLSVQALADGCDFLIAVGGDGTLSEVINGYLKAGKAHNADTALGVLPWGTGNDFVKTIGIEKSVLQLRDLMKSRSVEMIDAGQIIFEGDTGNSSIRYFDNIADLGIGAEVVSRVNGVHRRKNILGGTAIFFYTALRVFMTYRHKEVTVCADDFTWTGKLLSLVVANGRFFGSGLGIAPDARLDDGMFQVVIFGNLSVWDYLKNYGRIRKSRKLNLKEVIYLSAKEVKISSSVAGLIVEADGEVCGEAPVVMNCIPGVLPMLKPSTS